MDLAQKHNLLMQTFTQVYHPLGTTLNEERKKNVHNSVIYNSSLSIMLYSKLKLLFAYETFLIELTESTIHDQ